MRHSAQSLVVAQAHLIPSQFSVWTFGKPKVLRSRAPAAPTVRAARARRPIGATKSAPFIGGARLAVEPSERQRRSAGPGGVPRVLESGYRKVAANTRTPRTASRAGNGRHTLQREPLVRRRGREAIRLDGGGVRTELLSAASEQPQVPGDRASEMGSAAARARAARALLPRRLHAPVGAARRREAVPSGRVQHTLRVRIRNAPGPRARPRAPTQVVGSVRQASFWRTPAGDPLSRPLHPSGRHLQSATRLDGRARRYLSHLERQVRHRRTDRHAGALRRACAAAPLRQDPPLRPACRKPGHHQARTRAAKTRSRGSDATAPR